MSPLQKVTDRQNAAVKSLDLNGIGRSHLQYKAVIEILLKMPAINSVTLLSEFFQARIFNLNWKYVTLEVTVNNSFYCTL